MGSISVRGKEPVAISLADFAVKLAREVSRPMSGENAYATISRSPKKGKKYFSVDEANRALPYVARIVDDVTDCYRHAVQVRMKIQPPQPDQNDAPLRKEYESSMDQLNGLIDELQHVGVELKDLERGLIDFPSVFEGREICLCWHCGESSVHTWHEVDAGFAGRQDVTLLEQAQEG